MTAFDGDTYGLVARQVGKLITGTAAPESYFAAGLFKGTPKIGGVKIALTLPPSCSSLERSQQRAPATTSPPRTANVQHRGAKRGRMNEGFTEFTVDAHESRLRIRPVSRY